MVDQLGQPGLGTARIIATALAAGIPLFWIVAWVLTDGGQAGLAPTSISAGFAVWLVFGALVMGFGAALIFRGRAVGLGEAARREERELEAEEVVLVQTNLIIAFAMLEGPALLSGVFFLLLAENLLLWLAVPVYALGVFLTFPRAEWFGERGVQRAHLENE